MRTLKDQSRKFNNGYRTENNLDVAKGVQKTKGTGQNSKVPRRRMK